MKILAYLFISIQTVFWDLNLSRKAKQTDLQQLTQLQLTLWKMKRPVEEITELLSLIYSLLQKSEKCLILSIVTASALINFSIVEVCDVVIAVRPYNFTAHAWVEVDGKTIPPSESFTEYKEIIRIPFTKLGNCCCSQHLKI